MWVLTGGSEQWRGGGPGWGPGWGPGTLFGASWAEIVGRRSLGEKSGSRDPIVCGHVVSALTHGHAQGLSGSRSQGLDPGSPHSLLRPQPAQPGSPFPSGLALGRSRGPGLADQPRPAQSLMLAKAKECWDQEQEEREAEKSRYLSERVPTLQTRGLSLSALQVSLVAGGGAGEMPGTRWQVCHHTGLPALQSVSSFSGSHSPNVLGLQPIVPTGAGTEASQLGGECPVGTGWAGVDEVGDVAGGGGRTSGAQLSRRYRPPPWRELSWWPLSGHCQKTSSCREGRGGTRDPSSPPVVALLATFVSYTAPTLSPVRLCYFHQEKMFGGNTGTQRGDTGFLAELSAWRTSEGRGCCRARRPGRGAGVPRALGGRQEAVGPHARTAPTPCRTCAGSCTPRQRRWTRRDTTSRPSVRTTPGR